MKKWICTVIFVTMCDTSKGNLLACIKVSYSFYDETKQNRTSSNFKIYENEGQFKL